jgi:hypothetical protein
MLARITQVLSDLQSLLRRHDAIAFIGNNCPTLLASRWFDLVDVLEFLLEHRAAINSYFLIRHANDPLIPTCPSKEVFELHAILLPLKLMRLAVESRDSILGETVPVRLMVQSEMQNISSFIETRPSMQILRTILARFILRILTNNFEEAIAGYCLTPLGRDDLRKQQAGSRTIRSGMGLRRWNSGRIPLSEIPFRTTILELTNAISNAPSACECPSLDDEEESEDRPERRRRGSSSFDPEDETEEEEHHEIGRHNPRDNDLGVDEIEEVESEEQDTEEDLREFMRLQSPLFRAND